MSFDFDIREVAFVIVAMLIAITLHEAAHAYAALRCGDETAFRRGRVTLNPLKHIDPIGTMILPLFLLLVHAPFLFGYAKAVPVKWSALHNPKRDMSLVAAAGPAANLILGIAFALTMLVLVRMESEPPKWLSEALRISVIANFIMAIFNILPVPPLDGSKIFAGFLPDKIAQPYLRLGRFGFLPILIFVVALPLIVFAATLIRSLF